MSKAEPACRMILALLAGFTLASTAAANQASITETSTPEVRVSAPGISVGLLYAGSRVTVIDERAIRQKGARTVADLLRDEAGLTLLSQGGSGQLTQAYFRGLPAGQTLVLIDGVKVNDPSNPDRLFDFANLGTSAIDRIEIVHGAPAEIRIRTRKGHALSSEASLLTGSSGTLRSQASIQGANGPTRYRLGLEQLQSSGLSAAGRTSSQLNRDFEPDSRRSTTLTASASHAWEASGESLATLRWALSRNELDAFDGLRTLDDPEHLAWERSLQARLEQRLRAGGSWELSAAAAASLSRRLNENPPPSTGALRSQRYLGDRLQGEVSAARMLESGASVSIFSEMEREEAEFDDGVGAPRDGLRQDLLSIGTRIEGIKPTSDSSIGASARWMGSPTRGSALAAGLSHRVRLAPGLMARGSLASGARFPTLYQLHADLGAGFGGNPSLLPEKSWSLDAGLEWMDRKIHSSIGVFTNRIRDQIEFSATGYENIARTRTEGLETRMGYRNGRSNLVGQATWLAVARDDLTGMRLPQRPRLQLSVFESYALAPRLELSGNLRFHGSRTAGAAPVELPSYTILDAAVSWQLSPALALSGRLENLADRIYEEVPGYATPRRSIFAGIEGRLE